MFSTGAHSLVHPYPIDSDDQPDKIAIAQPKFDTNHYLTWSPATLTDYFVSQNIPVGDRLVANKIGGDYLDDLTDEDYDNMGFDCIGDKIAVKKAIFELQNLPRSYSNVTEYFYYRWQVSNVRKFYLGVDLTLAEADGVVNSLALVNALVLTIPFSVIVSLGHEYWDAVFDDLQKCGDYTYKEIYNGIIFKLYATAYCSMTSLAVCIFYFIFRPQVHLFSNWWRRGKWSLLFVLMGSISSIASMLTLYGALSSMYAFRSSMFCDNVRHNEGKYSVGAAAILVVNLLAVLLMI